MMHGEVTRIRNARDARNNFFDAAETVSQMVEFGYLFPDRDRLWFHPPNVDEERSERINQDMRERYLREIYFANRRTDRNRKAQAALEQRVREYAISCLITIPDEDLPSWREACQRELESLRELNALSSSTVDEQMRAPMRAVVRTRHSSTGTPNQKD